jgi:hypothetical protein
MKRTTIEAFTVTTIELHEPSGIWLGRASVGEQIYKWGSTPDGTHRFWIDRKEMAFNYTHNRWETFGVCMGACGEEYPVDAKAIIVKAIKDEMAAAAA